MATCVFCGSRADSREHVIPQWLTRAAPTEVSYADERWPILGSNGGPDRIISKKFGTTTVKCVCTTCNSGWMSSLEAQVQPFLVDIMLGARMIALDEGAQTALAAWSLKTVMMSLQTQPQRLRSVIPQADYTHLYENRRLSTRRMTARTFQVDVPSDDTSCIWAESAVQRISQPYGGYRALLRLGSVVVQIFSFRLPGGMALARFRELPVTVPLWPPQGPWHWPPPERAAPTTYERLKSGEMPIAFGRKKR